MARSESAGFLEITRVDQLPPELETLRRESVRAGFEFVTRLVEEWAAGAQCFAGEGEAFFIARRGEELVGVGGLSIDPYDVEDPPWARVRHLYVKESARGVGVGSALLEAIVVHAKKKFCRLRLRTFSAEASLFYVGRGFEVIEAKNATHEMKWLPGEGSLRERNTVLEEEKRSVQPPE